MSSPFLHPVFVWLQLYPADLSNNTDPCTDPNAPRQVAAWRTAHALVQATQGTGPTLDVDTSSAISCTLNNFTISEEPSDGCLKALWQCFDGSTPGDSLNFKFQLHFDIFTIHGRRAFPAPDSLPSSSSLLIPPKSLIWTECSALTAPTRKSRTLASGNQAATPRRWPVGMSANSFGSDDTMVFIGPEDDPKNLQRCLDQFCEASTARFNKTKTEIIPLGPVGPRVRYGCCATLL